MLIGCNVFETDSLNSEIINCPCVSFSGNQMGWEIVWFSCIVTNPKTSLYEKWRQK
jgi:hypothetical protein